MKKVISLLVLLFVLVGCGGNENGETDGNDQTNDNSENNQPAELEEISVVLDWTPNTNHTGLYVAKANGYFEEEGLDVEIIMPGEAGADQLVASGKADFGVSYQENITLARVQDVPIVSIATIIQHNTSGFASPVEKNIETPKDFEGKTYGGWGSPIEKSVIQSLMSTVGADVEKVDIISTGDTDFFTSVKRDIDFAWIYYAWTGVEAELRGVDLNMIYLTDYTEKLDYYTPVLATSEKMIEDNSKIAEKFVRAVSKGYQFAIEQPVEAGNILIEAEPDLDPELVIESQKWLASRYQDDAPRWGEQKELVWQNYADWMYEHDLLEEGFIAEDAFTNEFLPKGE
ncbi:ABC transporter substrate-binding protein [Bacillaceae bacterium S4-13-56]